MKQLTLLVTMVFLSLPAFAFEKESSFSTVGQALLESNKDYNDHKKKMLNEENNRITDWGDRDVSSITIKQGIQVEARDYQPAAASSSEKQFYTP